MIDKGWQPTNGTASDAGYNPAQPEAIDWTRFEVCDAVGMQIMRDLPLMTAEPSRLQRNT